MPLVSIIVPVYRVEPFLRRCVDSILAQTFTDFELILVDDGSPDRCGELCDEYEEKDSRIRVIHQQNLGAAAARNAGLDQAQGKYIAFCDADDKVSPLWLERLNACLMPQKVIMPVCAYCSREEELGNAKELSITANRVYPLSEYDIFSEADIAGFLWNALFDAEIVSQQLLRFRSRRDEGDYNEDLLFVLDYVKHVDGVVYTGVADYLYDMHADSLSSANKEHYFEKYQEKYQLWKRFILEHNDEEAQVKIGNLANRFLFPFMLSLSIESTTMKDYSRFKRIVESDEVQECVARADTSIENPQLVSFIRKKQVVLLWMVYILRRIRNRDR